MYQQRQGTHQHGAADFQRARQQAERLVADISEHGFQKPHGHHLPVIVPGGAPGRNEQIPAAKEEKTNSGAAPILPDPGRRRSAVYGQPWGPFVALSTPT